MSKICITLLGTLLFNVQMTIAQVEVSLSASYELPLGELKWIYQPTIGYALNLSRINETRVSRMLTGLEVGYLRFQPQEAAYYYLLDEEEYGTISYGNYQVFQFSGTFLHHALINEKLSLFIGTGVGYYYTSFTYDDSNSFVSSEGQSIEGRGAITPRVGANWMLTESLGVLAQGKYNATLGRPDISGLYQHYLSLGLGAFVKF